MKAEAVPTGILLLKKPGDPQSDMAKRNRLVCDAFFEKLREVRQVPPSEQRQIITYWPITMRSAPTSTGCDTYLRLYDFGLASKELKKIGKDRDEYITNGVSLLQTIKRS